MISYNFFLFMFIYHVFEGKGGLRGGGGGVKEAWVGGEMQQ